MRTACVILAAGQGSRMNSGLPKVLHKIAAAPLLSHVLRAAQTLEPKEIVVVTGHGAELVEDAIGAAARAVRQTEQLGTAHAVECARAMLEGFSGKVVVLYGDTPFISAETLARMQASPADVTVLGFDAADPGRYGRLVVSGDRLERIVEAKDATPAELEITLCNSGVLCAESGLLFDLLAQVGNDNAAGEYYLTDIIGLARAAGRSTAVVTCDEAETLGINTRAELAAAEQIFQTRARAEALENGVSLAQPETTYFAFDTQIGRDAQIGPQVVFGPDVTVESGANIRAFCHLEGCHVAQGAVIGPFARLRPGTELSEDTRVGNFVEIKNAVIAPGAKVNHLSYIGDTQVGARSNIGAGTITCNHDGIMKHRTVIGADTFIGSNTLLVAPVTVGDEAMTATGTTVTKDVPNGALAIGRARQENKPGFARKLMKILRAKKKKRDV